MDPNATCANHPERLAGSACQRCGKPICPSCMHAASVGFHCPECARSGRAKVINPVAQSRSNGFGSTPVTYTLLGLIIVAYIGQVAYSKSLDGGAAWNEFGVYAPAVAAGEWYRIFTSALLHSGPIHLLMNCYFIYVVGRQLERPLGTLNMIGLVLVGCVGGSVGALAMREFAGGASGIGFALMGFLAVLLLLRGGDLIASGLGQLLLLNLVITFAVPNIAIGGHIGGLIAGAIAAVIVEVAPKADLPAWVRSAGLYSLAIFLTGAAMVIAQNVN